MAVAIMPRLLVAVVAAGRDQLIQNRRQVLPKSGLELNGTDRRRAADGENVNGPGFDTRGTHDRCHSLGKVLHVAVTFGVDGNLLLIAHVWYLLTRIFRATELGANAIAYPCQDDCYAWQQLQRGRFASWQPEPLDVFSVGFRRVF